MPSVGYRLAVDALPVERHRVNGGPVRQVDVQVARVRAEHHLRVLQ